MSESLANMEKNGEWVEYSTEERVIGKWIDGKPLYQKTIDFGALPNANVEKAVPHGIVNLKKIVYMNGYAFDGTRSAIIPYTSCYDTEIMIFQSGGDGAKITIQTKSDRTSFKESYITLKYTKTTD